MKNARQVQPISQTNSLLVLFVMFGVCRPSADVGATGERHKRTCRLPPLTGATESRDYTRRRG